MFHHTDASGLSGRATNASGIAYTPGGSYEGAPIEADPMGGNMGIETPYVEEPPEPPSPAPDFPAFEVNEADPVYVNGQRATMTLNGMSIPFAVGMSILGRMADIDHATADPFVLGQLGISWVRREIGDNDAPVPPGMDPEAGYATTRYEYEYFFGNVSWAPQQQSGGGGGVAGVSRGSSRAAIDKKRFDKCLKDLFNAVLTSESLEEGLPGLYDDSIWYGVTIAGVATLLKTTFEKDSATLGRDLMDQNVGDGSPNAGATFDSSPFRSYIASDVYRNLSPMFPGWKPFYTAIGFAALKIHELGNALAGARRQLAQGRNNPEYGIRDTLKPIGGYGPENRKHGINDPDAGAALEICVFGGLVNLRTGRIGRTRGL